MIKYYLNNYFFVYVFNILSILSAIYYLFIILVLYYKI